MTKKRAAFEAFYRERLPDADFSKPIWDVEYSIWSAAWDAALTSPAEPPVARSKSQQKRFDAMRETEPKAELPYHLAEDSPPLLQCSNCGRKSWTTDEYLGICGMKQPSSLYCDGQMRRHERTTTEPT